PLLRAMPLPSPPLFRSVRSTRRCVRHQLPSFPPGIDSNLVVIQQRAGHVRSEQTAAFMMQLLADVEHHYTPRLEQHPSAAAAPVDRKSTRLNSSHEWTP